MRNLPKQEMISQVMPSLAIIPTFSLLNNQKDETTINVQKSMDKLP